MVLAPPPAKNIQMKSIGIACDHAGYELKEFLVGYLSSKVHPP